MNSTIFAIVFFTMPGKLPRDTSKIRKKNSKELIKAEKEVKKLAGKDVSEGKTLKALGNLAKTLVNANKEVAVGQIFITAIETVKDMVLHNNEPSALIHYNKNETRQTSRQKTVAYIGDDYSKTIKSFLNGPVHTQFNKLLFNSQQDAIESEYRKELKSDAGVNQRGTVFLGTQTFLTLDDLKELCNFNEEKKQIMKETERKNSSIRREKTEDIKKIFKSKGMRVKNDRRSIERRSALLKTKSTLKIYNRLPVYDSHVTINLVSFKTNGCDRTHTIDKLVSSLRPNSRSVLEKLTDTQLKKHIKPGNLNFSNQLITELGSKVTRLECFKDNCKVIKRWERTIPSGGEWEFTLKEKHKNGIYINKLLEFEQLGVDGEMPSSFFLIIEHHGSVGSVTRLSDGELISGVYSPSRLAFEYQLSISHISKNDEKDIDNIMNYKVIKKSSEFDDESLTDAFYPNRQERFNINMEDLIINDKNPDAKFKLELSDSILDSNGRDEISSIKKMLRESLNEEAANNFTHDDLEFEDTSNPNEYDDDHDNTHDSDNDILDLD